MKKKEQENINFKDIVEDLPYSLIVMNQGFIIEYANPSTYNIFPRIGKLEGKSIFELTKSEEVFDILKRISIETIPIINCKLSLSDETTREILLDVYPITQDKNLKYALVIKEISQINFLEKAEERKNQIRRTKEAITHIIDNVMPNIETIVSIIDMLRSEKEEEELKMLSDMTNKLYHYMTELRELTIPEKLDISKTNLHKILEDSISTTINIAKSKNIKIVRNYDPTLLEINANSLYLRKAISKIILTIFESSDKNAVISFTTKLTNKIKIKPEYKTILLEIAVRSNNIEDVYKEITNTNNPKILLIFDIINQMEGITNIFLKKQSLILQIFLAA